MQRRRAAHSKSRNGCLTCKVRKVKCDETLPQCKKCLVSGRVCEGPIVAKFHFVNDQQDDTSRAIAPQPEIGLLTPPHSPAERRAFHSFTSQWLTFPHKTIDSAFWTVLIPQLAQNYDFVWDIAVALGILDEHVPYMSLVSTFDARGLATVLNDDHARAIRHYNKAIASVRRLTEQNQLDDFVLTLSYILFASVEFRQRNVKIGNDLIKLCGRILTNNLSLPDTRRGSAAGLAVNEILVPFVLRRAVTIVTLGSGPTPRLIDDDETNDILDSILSCYPNHNDARLQLQELIFNCYELVRLADFVPFMPDDHPDKLLLESHRQSGLQALTQWKVSFAVICDSAPENGMGWLQSYLALYWTVCYISLAACFSIDETGFDAYLDHFAVIVRQASMFIEHCSEPEHGRMLSRIDPGVIPPLYFCATKCRDPQLRRQALELIRQARRQTDQWAFIAPDQVVARLIAVEEREFSQPSPDRTSEGDGPRLPVESCRYAYVGVVNRPIAGGKLRRALELGRYDSAKDGLRTLTNEYVWLDGDGDGFVYV